MVSKLSFCLHLQQVIAQLGKLHIFWAVPAPALCRSPPAVWSPDNQASVLSHSRLSGLIPWLRSHGGAGSGKVPVCWMCATEGTRQFSSSFAYRNRPLVTPLGLEQTGDSIPLPSRGAVSLALPRRCRSPSVRPEARPRSSAVPDNE